MKLHVFNNKFYKKIRTNASFNILLLLSICFFTIITLFLFNNSNQSRLLNLNNALTKCSENHQHQTADCIELTQLTSESLKNQIREKAKLLDETEKRLLATEKLLDEIAEIHRIEFGYEYLHDYRDEHKDAYKIYQ